MINNWADGALITPLPSEENELRKEWVPGDRFVVCYAGNLGRAHDVDTILSAMTLLQERAKNSPSDPAAKVVFVFVGGGAKRAKLEREALKRGLTNFCMRPYQPRERLGETLGVADVHLVSLDPAIGRSDRAEQILRHRRCRASDDLHRRQGRRNRAPS